MEKNRLFSLFLFCFCLLFFSCGLDEYYVLDAPTAYHVPTVTGVETYPNYDESYFSFYTAEEGVNNRNYLDGSAGFKFLGTDIYYKIYKHYSTMSSHISAISSLVSSTNESAAATRLIETYTYQTLGLKDSTNSPLIFNKDSNGNCIDKNLKVEFRLTNYGEDFPYYLKIFDGSNNLLNEYIPMRHENELSFDFGRTALDENVNKVPEEGDADLNTSGSSSDDDDQWYVALYAVSVAQDITLSRSYSTVTFLGSVCIFSDTEDN